MSAGGIRGRDFGARHHGVMPAQHSSRREVKGCRLPAPLESGTLLRDIARRSAEMSDQPRAQVAPVEPYFDRTPQPFGDGLPDPLVYDASPRALHQRTVNFAAKRL